MNMIDVEETGIDLETDINRIFIISFSNLPNVEACCEHNGMNWLEKTVQALPIHPAFETRPDYQIWISCTEENIDWLVEGCCFSEKVGKEIKKADAAIRLNSLVFT